MNRQNRLSCSACTGRAAAFSRKISAAGKSDKKTEGLPGTVRINSSRARVIPTKNSRRSSCKSDFPLEGSNGMLPSLTPHKKTTGTPVLWRRAVSSHAQRRKRTSFPPPGEDLPPVPAAELDGKKPCHPKIPRRFATFPWRMKWDFLPASVPTGGEVFPLTPEAESLALCPSRE